MISGRTEATLFRKICLAASAANLIAFGATNAALADGTFIKPVPVPAPAPVPPAPAPAIKKPRPVQPAPPNKKPVTNSVVTPDDLSKGHEDVDHPKPVTGTVESIAGKVLLVDGHRLQLAGIKLNQGQDNSDQLRHWIDHSGGHVSCQPIGQNEGYRCFVNGLDIALALVFNSAAVPAENDDRYEPVYKITQTRDSFVAENSGPIFEAFRAGTIKLDCQSPFTCGAKFMFGGWKEDNRLVDAEDWAKLIPNIVRTGFRVDINYYYLGYAAEQLGFLRASAVYYQEASRLASSGNPIDHCSNVEAATCNGVDVIQSVNENYPTLLRFSAYEF